jgi:hypothetical protein
MIPDTINKIELSKITGWTDRQHRQIAAEGYFPAPVKGQYQLVPTFKGLARYWSEQLASKEDSIGPARKSYLEARTKAVELQTDIERGKYVQKSEIGHRAWRRVSRLAVGRDTPRAASYRRVFRLPFATP